LLSLSRPAGPCHVAEPHRFGNYLKGTHVEAAKLCNHVALVAPAPGAIAARTCRPRGYLATPSELPGIGSRFAKSRDGNEACGCARRQHNTLLLAAGFAPVWRQTDLAAPELGQIRSALDYMMAQQEPFPAFVVDRHWNLLRSNSGAVRLVEFLVGPLPPGTPVNLADHRDAGDASGHHGAGASC
jgi:hypothetical protein